jgi:hypothetical protein
VHNDKIAAEPIYRPGYRLKSPCKLNKFLCAAVLSTAVLPAFAAPSTFGTVIGQGLLCLSQLNVAYFYDYLSQAFGPPYKHEGNAYWFKTPASLWGAPVSEVMVSDKESPEHFIAAVADVTPEALTEAIAQSVHIGFTPTSKYANPVRMSQAASTIVYYQKKSKIFCATAKELMPDK